MAELPISFSRFLGTSNIGSGADAVYEHAMRVFHGREKHTSTEWSDLLAALKSRPVERKAQTQAGAPRAITRSPQRATARRR